MFNPAHLFCQGSFPAQFHFFIPRPCPLLSWSHSSLPRPHPSMPISHPHCSGHTHSCPGPAYLALASPTLHSPVHFWLGPTHYNLDPTSPAQAPPSMPGTHPPSSGHTHSCSNPARPCQGLHRIPPTPTHSCPGPGHFWLGPTHHTLDPPSPAQAPPIHAKDTHTFL